MTRFIVTDWGRLGDELCASLGIDQTYVSRLVLDLKVGEPGRLYFEAFADDNVLNVSLGDAQIKVWEENA